MDKYEFKNLIEECMQEIASDDEADKMSDDISRSTPIGKEWSKIISALRSMHDEIKNFEGLYRTSISKLGKPANLEFSLQKIREMAKILQEIQPTIKTMSVIQSRDSLP